MRAVRLIPGGGAEAAATVTLDFEARSRRRIAMATDQGAAFLLDLPEAGVMCEGDGLVLEDGAIIGVRAAQEAVADLAVADLAVADRAAAGDGALVRLAWHLGNRHLPVQVFADRLRIRRDAVIEDMAARLGAVVSRLEAPFHPEGGAYGHGRTHTHEH